MRRRIRLAGDLAALIAGIALDTLHAIGCAVGRRLDEVAREMDEAARMRQMGDE